MPPAVKYGDRVGLRYGRLTVLAKSDRSHKKRTYWICRCDCGAICAPRSDALTSEATQSCGCLQREMAAETGHASRTHGATRSRLYRIWAHMKGRCLNEKDAAWEHYGGRGVTVCERWLSFENFQADMGSPPPKLTLERVNTNKGYSPDNCIWATQTAQCRNRRIAVRVITPVGLLSTGDYADYAGIRMRTAASRVYRGTVPSIRVGEMI